jgi:4-hydroxybenzoate polyprenyltransferase/phosphoserine phosphatase
MATDLNMADDVLAEADRMPAPSVPGEGALLPPIVVDLDGTLTPCDTLAEGLVQLAKRSPLHLLRAAWWLGRGRAYFKAQIAAEAEIDIKLLPYRAEFLDYLRAQKASGRKIILATAAHRRIAETVAAELGLFDAVYATEGEHNLKGAAKLAALRRDLPGAFVYAGDSRADLPIWQAAEAAILVGVSPGLAASLRGRVAIEREFPGEKLTPALWLRALRLHQWLKNLLLFVPLLTAFSFAEPRRLIAVVFAFLAFSLTASATYLVNDLIDLDADRAHRRKRRRPLASGRIPIRYGVVAAGSLLAVGFVIGFLVSLPFAAMLLAYLVTTSGYSYLFKKYVLIDVIVLSILYTLRILAGSVASGIADSSWLLAFSVFIFLSLALVKRCAELVQLAPEAQGQTRDRDYRVSDLAILWPLGVGSALSAVVIFGLFISAPETQARYATPQFLWLVAIGLLYWTARLWIKTSRGEMHDDPIVYTIRDRGSRIVILGMIALTLAAHVFAVPIPWIANSVGR